MVMMNQLNPYDHCEIHCPQTITSEHQLALQLCYQPIIGVEATALYLKLWVETQQHEKATCFHSNLLDSLSFKPKQLLEARIVLEAIGLVKSFEKMMDSYKSMKYILYPPLTGHDFFDDSILSVALLRKIGREHYESLRNKLAKHDISLQGYKDVTCSFNDAFVAITETELKQVMQENTGSVNERSKMSYPFEYDLFDFKSFMMGMSQNLIPSKLFTLDIKIAIAKLAFMYNFSVTDMQRIVLLAWDTDEGLTKKELEKRCEEYYQLNVGVAKPKLIKKQDIFRSVEVINTAPAKTQQNINDKEGLIEYLEKTSPIEVFQKFNGYLPPESVVMEFNNFIRKGVSYGTLNVLIHYISMNDELNYNKNFMKVVMNNWLKKGAKTAENTMEIAKVEHSYRDRKSKNLSQITVTNNDLNIVEENNNSKTDSPDSTLVDFKNSTPYQYLLILTHGEEPFSGHVKIAESLYSSYDIPIEVANVIIRHVWDSTKGNLPESFVEALASEIRYNQIKTAEQALDYIEKRNERNLIKVTEDYLTVDDQSIHYDKTVPYYFLKSLYKGKKPVKFIVDLAEELVLQQGLSVGAVNVLMEYAYNESNGKLTKNFVQSIAGNWMLNPPANALEALRIVEESDGTQLKASKITMDTPLAFKVTVKDMSKWIPAFDETLPYDFMKNLLNGKEPVEMLVKQVDDLVLKHGIKVGVVNAILEFILTNKTSRFGRNQIQTLALNMQLKNILLAKDALAYIESNYKENKVDVKITEQDLPKYYPPGYVFTPELARYEKATPYVFTKELNDGHEPFAYVVATAEKLILHYKMVPAVVNYMLEYVMEKTEGALPEKYINSVANTWRNNKIQTINQAKIYTEMQDKKNKQRGARKVGVVPDWFKEKDQEPVQQANSNNTPNNIDFEEQRKKLLEQLNSD